MSTGPDEVIAESVARVLDGCAATCHLWPEQERRVRTGAATSPAGVM